MSPCHTRHDFLLKPQSLYLCTLGLQLSRCWTKAEVGLHSFLWLTSIGLVPITISLVSVYTSALLYPWKVLSWQCTLEEYPFYCATSFGKIYGICCYDNNDQPICHCADIMHLRMEFSPVLKLWPQTCQLGALGTLFFLGRCIMHMIWYIWWMNIKVQGL